MAKAPTLSPSAGRIIDSRVDDVFDRLMTRLFGHAFTGKRLYIGFHEDYSLPGIYNAAVTGEGGRADTYVLDNVIAMARDYLDKARADAKAKTKGHVQNLLRDVAEGRIEHSDFANHVESELHTLWDSVRSNVERIVETENEHAKTLGIKDGIDQINESLGIDDPTVCFIPVKDDALCDECRRLHLLPDGVTPRVWHSSEVLSGYHKRNEDRPSWQLLHPHCRCALATVLPGFGFNAEGRITWIAEGHDELAYQRGYKRPPKGEGPRLKRLQRSEGSVPAPERRADVPAEDVVAHFNAHLPPSKQGENYSHILAAIRRYPTWRLASLPLAEGYRNDTLPPEVHEYAKLTTEPPPIIARPSVPGSAWKWDALDGNHRVEAQRLRGATHISGYYPVVAKAEPLLKFDVKYADLARTFKQYGWQDQEGGSHVVWKHPSIPARPVTVKRDHASGSQAIDDDMLRNKYLKQAGLVIQRDGSIAPSARHPYAEHYAKLGFEVPGFDVPAQPKTWVPQRAPEGVQHVPIDDLEAGPFEEWQAALHTKNFNLGKGHLVPHVTAMDLGDGRLTVDRGSEVVEAARRAGMTHVPVLVG